MGAPSRYLDLKYSPWKNYDGKNHDLSEPCDTGPPNRPPIMYQERSPTIFFFKNVFDHVFSTMPGFKSLKNTFFFAIFEHYCVIHSLLGPPNRAPNYMKMLPFKNSNIFELLNNAVCLPNKRNLEVQTQSAKSN